MHQKIFSFLSVLLFSGISLSTSAVGVAQVLNNNSAPSISTTPSIDPLPTQSLSLETRPDNFAAIATNPSNQVNLVPAPINSNQNTNSTNNSNNNRCLVTLFGNTYDVTPLKNSHSGGDIFVCGTDMSSTYQGQHGTNLSRMQAYLISNSSNNSSTNTSNNNQSSSINTNNPTNNTNQSNNTNNNRCLVTLFGNTYDVTPLKSGHPGGDIFVCGTDMSSTYQSQHGTNLSQMQAFLVSSNTNSNTGSNSNSGSNSSNSNTINTGNNNNDDDKDDDEDDDKNEDHEDRSKRDSDDRDDHQEDKDDKDDD